MKKAKIATFSDKRTKIVGLAKTFENFFILTFIKFGEKQGLRSGRGLSKMYF